MQLELLGFPPGVLGLTPQQEGGGTMTIRRHINRILQREFKKSFIKVRGGPNEIVNVHQILCGTKEVFHRFLGGVIEVTDLECGH